MWLIPICVKSNYVIFLSPGSQLQHMEPGNNTQNFKFLLLRFSEAPELQPLVFGIFLSMYLITVFGNLVVILALCSDPQFHTTIYFFVSNLSFVDICLTSITIPKMLMNIQTEKSHNLWRLHRPDVVLHIFATLDDFLMTVMACDWFMAICHPLHYTVIMSPQLWTTVSGTLGSVDYCVWYPG